MFSSSKNLSHQQALVHIQSLFPAVTLLPFSSNLSLKIILESVSNSLLKAQCKDHQIVLSNMKSVVDTQEYKIQRNMIEIQDQAQKFEIQGCSLDSYDQRSTVIDFSYRNSAQTSVGSVMSDQLDDLWWNLQQKNNIQQELQKQCFSFLD